MLVLLLMLAFLSSESVGQETSQVSGDGVSATQQKESSEPAGGAPTTNALRDQAVGDQQGATANPDTDPVVAADDEPVTMESLVKRVNELESRVDVLQQLLFRTVKLDQLEAVERYKQAKSILENSQRLQIRGLITAAEVDQDRYDLEKARLELLLARSNTQMDQISVQIDLTEARSQLRLAQQQLQYSESLLAKGMISEQEWMKMKREVADRERAVQFQTQRLESVEKLVRQSRQALVRGQSSRTPAPESKESAAGQGADRDNNPSRESSDDDGSPK